MKTDLVSLLYLAQGLSPIIGFIAHYFVVVNVPRQNYLIFAYLVICFFADGFAYFQMLPIPVIFNIHDILQFVIIITIYIGLFQQRAGLYIVITIVVYILGITTTVRLRGFNVYHTYMWALSSLLISAICIVFLCVANAKPKEFANNKDAYNTLVMTASFLFYFLAAMSFFLFAEFIFKKMSDEWARITWLYHNIIGLLKNIGLAVAIFLTGKAKVAEDPRKAVSPRPYRPGKYDADYPFTREHRDY